MSQPSSQRVRLIFRGRGGRSRSRRAAPGLGGAVASARAAGARGLTAASERGRGAATCAGSAGLRSCALLGARHRHRRAFESANSAARQPADPPTRPDCPEEPRVSDRSPSREASPAPPGWGPQPRGELAARASQRRGALPGVPRCRSLWAGKRFGSPGIGAGGEERGL